MTTSVSKPYTEVTPSLTASRATGYVPPDATGDFSAAFPSATTTTRPHVPNPSTPAFINDYQWINGYLVIHKMSTPSYRYSFLLWIFLVLVVLVFAVVHWTGSRGGFLGAAWAKWAIRRRTWRKKHALAQAKREGKPFKQPFSFPSNAQMLSLVLLFVVPLVLCVVGPDYIAPYTDLWDLTHNVTARGLNDHYMQLDLQSRAIASTATTRSPEYTIPKAWWTAGGRTGIMAFALFPLVTLFALKAPPFAVFAIPFLIQIHFDKLARLHRWTGRLIWFITTVHVFTWGVQLGRDKRGTGNRLYPDAPAWQFAWQYPLFIEGVIAYISLTALVILSLDSFRVRYYEAFYVLHIILVPVTLVFAALHFPTIWWWCWSALFLWAGERLHRAIRWAFVNGLLGKGKIPKGTIPRMPKPASPRLMEKRGTSNNATGEARQDWELGQKPQAYNPMSSYDSGYDRGATGQFSLDSYADFDPQTPNNRHSSYSMRDDPHKRGSTGTTGSNSELLQQYPPVPQSPRSAHPLNEPRVADGDPSPTYPPTVASQPHGRYSRIPPPGFALAQLLPGRVVRLRLLTPRPIVWAPGQHVLLQVPDVSKYTTHPFTISGCYDDQSETGEGRVVELLVRAKNGFTKELWEHVVQLSAAAEKPDTQYPFAETGYGNAADVEHGFGANQHQSNPREKQGPKKPREPGGILMRAYVDGPFGSSIRAHWGNHATVLIVVGGTGSSFGISILEYLCLCLAGRDGQTLGGRPGGWGHKGFKTTRVRFIWLIREFSHIQWCATIIRRCMDLVPSGALQVDIFVSNTEVIKNNRNSILSDPNTVGGEELLPPTARFMRRDRAGSESSQESLTSAMSANNSMVDLSYLQQRNSSSEGLSGEVYHSHELGHEGHVLDYTNFDGEVDTKAPGEAKISKRLHKEGKLRRAKSRKTAAAVAAKMELDHRAKQGLHGSTAPTPPAPDFSHDRSVPRLPTRSGRTSPSWGHANLPIGASSPVINPPSSFDARYAVSAADLYRPDVFLSPADQAQRRWSQQSLAGLNLRTPSPGQQTQENRFSVASLSDVYRGRSPSPGPGTDSVQGLVTDGRPGRGMAELEPRIEIDDQELEDIQVVSEMARPGKPKIERILADEVGRARGAVAVACCGPASLNALVRKTVASQINPSQVLHGEMQGMITLITEEFQW